MPLLSFLKSKDFDPAEFEKELSKISKKISSNERNIVKFRYQQRKVINFIIFYGIVIWSLISAYTVLHKSISRLTPSEYSLGIGIPVLIFSSRFLVQKIYELRINRATLTIEQLKNLHGSKIDELKEKTKYSSTQALLSRFGQGTDIVNEIDEEIKAKQLELESLNNAKAETTKRKKWYDSVIDGIIGDELGPESRYALICENCHIHNGLAPPGKLPDQVKYICSRCGFINGKKALLEPSASTSAPTSAPTSTVDEAKVPEMVQLDEKEDL